MPNHTLIEIATKNGPKLRRAKLFGPLAIHSEQQGQSTITHVRTGYAILHVLDRDADALAQLLKSLDWDFVRPEDVPKHTLAEAQKIVRDFCERNRARSAGKKRSEL